MSICIAVARQVSFAGRELYMRYGSFMETTAVLAGVLIETRDRDEDVQIAAGIAFARLDSMAGRPIVDLDEPGPKL